MRKPHCPNRATPEDSISPIVDELNEVSRVAGSGGSENRISLHISYKFTRALYAEPKEREQPTQDVPTYAVNTSCLCRH